MFNWNDIRVEQEIAQERYQVIVQGRRLARTRSQENRRNKYARFRNWLGDQVINWGCQVKAQCQAA
jgi:hypothetical protein